MASKIPYVSLSIRAPERLAILRSKSPTGNWRDARACGFHNGESYSGQISPGFNPPGKTPIYSTHAGPYFRDERFADDVVANIRHKGWYSDTDCGATVRGIVARLPHGRFIAGYYWSDNGERVYYPESFDDATDAAHAADSRAERYAEICMEDSERFNAAQSLQSEIESLESDLREYLGVRHARARLTGRARRGIWRAK